MGGLAQNVQKPPPGKNVQKCQGQIFQECQGQMPRSNAKVKCQGQMSQGQMGNRKKPEKWESVTKMKKPKRLKEKMIM